jgi:hypothetical protein
VKVSITESKLGDGMAGADFWDFLSIIRFYASFARTSWENCWNI